MNKQLTIPARDCFKLMTNPRNKSDELSETTKTWLKEKAIEASLGIRHRVETKPIKKAQICKDDSIALYNKVTNKDYIKNTLIKVKNGFSGKPDLLGDDCAIKITTSWDATTFPFFRDEVSKLIKKAGLEWQCRAYMMLFDTTKAWISYCLVDTPCATPKGELLLSKWDNWTLHRFDNKVDAHKRVSTSEVIERDAALEKKMLERYKVANRYYQKYLEEIERK